MPRNYKHKTDKRYAKHKKVPDKFRAGFLANMDQRTDLAKALRANYEAIVSDVGGQEDVGHVKNALVERFVWLEAILQTLEHEMATGQIDKGEALGRWIQAVNALSGLAKVLGVDRKSQKMPWLPVTLPSTNGANTNGANTNGANTNANGDTKGEQHDTNGSADNAGKRSGQSAGPDT